MNVTLSDLLFLAGVVPVLLMSFLRPHWWLGPVICTTSQATNNATMFCTFYSMVATAFLHHMAVAQPELALPSGRGARLLLCGAMWVLGLTASLPNWLFQRVVVEEGAAGARACLLLLSPAQTSCYFALLGALAFLPCILGLGCSFSHVAWFMWTQPRGPSGESIQEHRENTGLVLVVLVVFVLMWGSCSMLGYVAAVGGLPATPVAFVASSLCTILAYSQLRRQPHPLLLPLLPLPDGAQGSLLQAGSSQAPWGCGWGQYGAGACPAGPGQGPRRSMGSGGGLRS